MRPGRQPTTLGGQAMNGTERLLKHILRLCAVIAGLAVVAVFMPAEWMNIAHRWLGLGDFPTAPITLYMARSLSARYVMYGGVYWVVSHDVRRHAAVIRYLALAGILFAILVFVVDKNAGLPPCWTFVEGPTVMAFSVLILLLAQRIAKEPDAGRRTAEVQASLRN